MRRRRSPAGSAGSLRSSAVAWIAMARSFLVVVAAHPAAEHVEKQREEDHDQHQVDHCQQRAVADIGAVAKVYELGAEKLIEFNGINPEFIVSLPSAQLPKVNISEAQLIATRAVLEQQVSNQILKLEDRIGMLATAVSVSPFFGLFGTVWGVMMAFCGLAAQGKADISALAPGVSGALLTTVVGMLVAIPSLIGYNLLTISIKKLTIYMDNFVEEFLARVKLEQLD